MTAPADFSSVSGSVEVWSRRNGSNYTSIDPYAMDPAFRADSVENGTRSRVSTAKLSLNRSLVIRGDITEPNITNEAIFAVVWKQNSTTVPIVLFEGIPNTRHRGVAGGESAGDQADLSLVTAAQLWDQSPESQCSGRMVLKPSPTVDRYMLAREEGLPLIFNEGGRPNRSVKTFSDATGIAFGGPPAPEDVHYFAEGYDYFEPQAGTGVDQARKIREPRYWTYAQILAYLLAHHAGASTAAGSTFVARNGVKLFFGSPPNTAPTGSLRLQPEWTTLWGAIIGRTQANPSPANANYIYKLEANATGYEDFIGPPPPLPAFSMSPKTLLNQKAITVNCEGQSLLDSIAMVLQMAGLGWYIDSYQPFTNLNTFPADMIHVLRVWTPGGELLQAGSDKGIGPAYQPKLQPWGTEPDTTATAILSKNNVDQMQVNWDAARIVNTPRVKRSATRYEVTMYLRPGWEPIKHRDVFLLDNIHPTAMWTSDPSPVTQKPEIQVAEANAMMALYPGIQRPSVYYNFPPNSNQRIDNLWDALHANGAQTAAFRHVLRKWIVPTDLRYPNDLFKRDTATLIPFGMPWWYGTYKPVDFSAAVSPPGTPQTYPNVLLNPIPGSQNWPLRPRPLGPCLVSGSTGSRLGIKLELSFDSGTSWFEWNGFAALPDECGVMLNYQSPLEVLYPAMPVPVGGTPNQSNNLISAYLRHTLRVRVTGTIEGSETASDKFIILPSQFASGAIQRARLDIRGERFGKDVLLSKHTGRTVDNPHELDPDKTIPNQTPPPTDILDPNAPAFVYRQRDDSVAATYEANRSQAMMGDPKVSGVFVHPWIEVDEAKTLRPGYVVEKIVEAPAAPGGDGRVNWGINFGTQTVAGGSGVLAPHISGIVYTFRAGGFRTQVTTEDWRAIAERGPA